MTVVRCLFVIEILLGIAAVAFESHRRRRAGRVLFDLGSPNEGMGLSQPRGWWALGTSMLAFGTIIVFSQYKPARGLMFVLQGELFLAMASFRIQIREMGIMGKKLIPWTSIQQCALDYRGILHIRQADGLWRRIRPMVPQLNLPGAARFLESATGQPCETNINAAHPNW